MRNTVSDQLYYSTVRIECGDGTIGTAYIMSAEINKSIGRFLLVSNRHIVENKSDCRIVFHKAKSINNQEKIGTYSHKFRTLKWRDAWKFHPDANIDLAILDITPYLREFEHRGVYIFFRAISVNHIPTESEINLIRAMEEITFVGYPAGLIDLVNNLPIARRGSLATPLHENFDGKPEFLIDASVFGGSSGSPVCILNENGYTDTNGNMFFGNIRFFLIGTIFQQISLGHDNQSIDIGKVLKSETILESIEYNLFPDIRKAIAR